MKHIVQPGPAPAERIQCVEARGRRVSFDLPPGQKLLDAVRSRFAGEGFVSGVLRLEGGAFGPLAYVIPALSPTGEHAAYYSETFRPQGRCPIHAGALTFGTRDRAPFFHCHALWTEAGGSLRGGHVLPEETIISEPIRAHGVGLAGALFSAEPDPETNFTLFQPVPQPGGPTSGERRLFALRLRPNQDLALSLEDFCRERTLPGALLHGGVGSIIGARFTDGGVVEPFATEMAIRAGRIERRDGALACDVDVALVDLTGAAAEGRLRRGSNPVLMTLEIVLEPSDEP